MKASRNTGVFSSGVESEGLNLQTMSCIATWVEGKCAHPDSSLGLKKAVYVAMGLEFCPFCPRLTSGRVVHW